MIYVVCYDCSEYPTKTYRDLQCIVDMNLAFHY